MNALVPPLVPAGSATWSTALPDWKDRIRGGRSLVPDLPLDAARADRALRIFKALVVPDLEGMPRNGDVCDEWVFDLVRAVFGAFDAETGARMIREYMLLVPKKNTKTSVAAAIIVVAAILNERPSAELQLIAPTMTIAELSFDQAAGIIKHSVLPSGKELADLFSVHEHVRTIKYLNPAMPSEIKVKAADADVVTGSKAAVTLIDETHVFASRPAAKGVFVEIRGGLSHPLNKGFLLQITTQSKVAPQGVFKSELQRAREVRDGKIVQPLLPILYELPPEDAADGGWKNPATWGMVNPNLNRSVSADFLADELAKAEADGPEALALFASQHLNVEIGQSLFGDSWSGARHWPGCARAVGVGLDHILTECEVAAIGVDWGGSDDLASLAVIGRRQDDKVWLHWQRSWARPTVFEQRKAIAPTLEGFIADGDLVLVETPEEQAEQAADICLQLYEGGLLPEAAGIGLDAFGVALLLDALEARGLVQPLVQAVGQGYKLQTAITTLPLKLEARRLLHGGQRMMAWAVGNAKQELKGSNYIVTKQAAGAAKIDPLMATFNAAMLMLLNPQAAGAKATPWDMDPDYRMVS